MNKKRRHPSFPKLLLFKHPQGQSNKWYCGFHYEGKFIRASTKKERLKDAYNESAKWYLSHLANIDQGTFHGLQTTKFKN